MTWVAWRQFRTQALVTLGLLVAFAALLIPTGLHLHDIYNSVGGAACTRANDCNVIAGHDKVLAVLIPVALLVIPAVIGMFWGAPLVARELESGTYRLAWTQSVTRRRWLLTRIAIVGLAALVVAGLASWLVTWWFVPLDHLNMNRFDTGVFSERGIVSIGYAGFAFALGVAAGALARRTVPAMLATLFGFIAVRVVFTLWIREHLLPSRHVLRPLTFGEGVGFLASPGSVTLSAQTPTVPNGWGLSATFVDRAQHPIGASQLHELVVRNCPALASGPPSNPAGIAKTAAGLNGEVFEPCLAALSKHVQLLWTYQPAGHYWPMQWIELGVYLVAGLALLGVALWRVGGFARRHKAVGGVPDEPRAEGRALEVAG
jgi:hypothetical protein